MNTPKRSNFDPDGLLDSPDCPAETSQWYLQIQLEEEELQFDMEPHAEPTKPLTPEAQTITTNVSPLDNSHEEPMDVSSPTSTPIGDTEYCIDVRGKDPDPATINMSDSEKRDYHWNLRVDKHKARSARWSKEKETQKECKQ